MWATGFNSELVLLDVTIRINPKVLYFHNSRLIHYLKRNNVFIFDLLFGTACLLLPVSAAVLRCTNLKELICQ